MPVIGPGPAERLALAAEERAMLAGEHGEAARHAMDVLVRYAANVGADRFVPITGAHIDSCLYHGQASLDFAERLVGLGARVRVPATLNVGAIDLLHPELFRGGADSAARARRLMELYVAMGCEPTYTCAPYQLARRPGLGEHVAWAESNAIVFANAVLGARTDRYGDFIDILAAIAGRAPFAGLHRPEHRLGTLRFALDRVPDRLLDEDVLYPILGHVIGERAGTAVPVIEGLPAGVSEDRLKALAAAAASSGAVAMFHAVGSTPEAPTADAACGGRRPTRTIRVGPAMLRDARDRLTTRFTGPLAAMSLGTPHFSIDEFERLLPLVDGAAGFAVDFYVSTSRSTLEELERRDWARALRTAGVTIVVDTCTYITPILARTDGLVMTNSAKWAYYAPANLGVDVAFGSLEECVRSARAGVVVRDESLWGEWPPDDVRAEPRPGAASRVAAPASDGSPADVPVPDEAAARQPPPLTNKDDRVTAPWTATPVVHCRPLVAGEAAGRALVLDEPISFWGGIHAADGRIVEPRHPQHGHVVTGRVLILPAARGSSSSASILAEMVRAGTAPAAIVLREPDTILPIGAMVGAMLYARTVPIVVLDADDRDIVFSSDVVMGLSSDGELRIRHGGPVD